MPEPKWSGRQPHDQGPPGPPGPAGASTLAELTDVTGTPGTYGNSPTDDGTGVFPLTRSTTQEDLTAILDSVAATVWLPLTLADGITNNDGYVPGRYRLTLNNTVYLEGVLTCEPPLTEAQSGRPIATISPDCNPGYTLIFSVAATGQGPVELRIQPDGSIIYQSHFYGTGSASIISLCGVCYSVDTGPVVTDALQARFGP